MAAWSYDGADTLSVTIPSVSGHTYSLIVNAGGVPSSTATATGATLTLTVSNVTLGPSGVSGSDTFDAVVKEGTADITAPDGDYIAATVFRHGETAEQTSATTWAYDGTTGVSATFVTAGGVTYHVGTSDPVNGLVGSAGVVGDGTSRTVSLTLGSAPSGVFYAYVFRDDITSGGTRMNRLFTALSAGSGSAGNPAGASLEFAQGVSIAFNDSPLQPDPTWTRLDDTPNLVAEWTSDRGRADELEQTDTGRATVTINDKHGILDPLNTLGPYYGLIRPRLQIQLSRHNPVTDQWFSRFRGFIEKLSYQQHPSQKVMQLVIDCVGPFAILHQMEMAPGAAGTTVPPGAEGFIFYEDAEVNDRLAELAADANYPSSRCRFFSGNVIVQETTYSPGESFMTGMQEAAEAEFPGVANLYEDRRGIVAFHGRFARFDPATVSSGTDWEFTSWKCGDGAAVQASISDTAQIRGITSSEGIEKIINAALAQPKGVVQDTVASLLVTDPTSITAHGLCSWSADNLIIKQHKNDGTAFANQSANAECILFNTYYVQNFASAKDRIDQIVFRSLQSSDARAAALWDLLCRIDISDEIQVDVTNPGGGGFVAAMFFVEGVHEEERELDGVIKDVTLTIDVSPQGYFTNDPFS